MKTLAETIKHCEEVAGNKCDKCGMEHRQLAEWLEELKERRENMGDNKKLFCVTLSGHYSMSYGWDDGWNIGSVYPCTMDGNIARFTVKDRDFDCKIKPDFVSYYGGQVDCLRDNAGSRSADVYVWADNADDAKAKAHHVIMKFWPPSAYYKEVTAWMNF